MAEYGLSPEDYADDVCEVWPDNVDSLRVFIAMRTQWQWVSLTTGMGGAIPKATGLNYSALPVVMEIIGIPEAARLDVFEDIQIMEDAALAQMRQNK